MSTDTDRPLARHTTVHEFEQAIGERSIAARSDVCALGVVTYEMLAGDPQFTGSIVQAVVTRMLSERPTPIETLRDRVPPAVADAVMGAPAKLPADRFTTSAEFAAALCVAEFRRGNAGVHLKLR